MSHKTKLTPQEEERILQRRKGYVYYACDGHGRIKIGFSINPWARIKEMRRFNPSMEILAVERDIGGSMVNSPYSLEKRRHKQFKEFHLALEWFKASDELLDFIMNLGGSDTTSKNEASSNDLVEKRHSEDGLSSPAQLSTIDGLRQLVKMVTGAPVEPVVPKPLVFRNDHGQVISETHWNVLQKRKQEAKDGGYEIDDYTQ